MNPRLQKKLKAHVKDVGITALAFFVATILCFLLKSIDNNAISAPMVFILAVFLVSRLTNGYVYGIVASFISVLLVNYIFLYPYFKFDFTITGYPVTLICMLVVAIVTSTLTIQNKRGEASRMEAEREKTRGNLLRAVSHDLRTPLTSIEGACSFLLDHGSELSRKKQTKLYRDMRDESHWLIRMVENLLSITKIDGENAQVQKKPEAVEEIIADVAMKFHKIYPDNMLRTKIPEELLILPMDAMLIEQVLINLLENAVVHAEGATEIVLSVKSDEHGICFSVEDNGRGIEKSLLPFIFEGYFSRSYEKKSDKKKCMGIGLSVCQTIIAAHGGAMHAENKEQGGAKFYFVLPND